MAARKVQRACNGKRGGGSCKYEGERGGGGGGGGVVRCPGPGPPYFIT